MYAGNIQLDYINCRLCWTTILSNKQGHRVIRVFRFGLSEKILIEVGKGNNNNDFSEKRSVELAFYFDCYFKC